MADDAENRVESDAMLIEASLGYAAEHDEDITNPVFERFFAAAPAARDYFELDEIDPRARGRMLAEVLTLIVDGARGESYVGPTFRTQVGDHQSYGVIDPALYSGFLDALVAVVRDLAGPNWTDAAQAAWDRQAAALVQAGFRR